MYATLKMNYGMDIGVQLELLGSVFMDWSTWKNNAKIVIIA